MRTAFDDGDAIDQHPTKEDPVVYYLPSGQWARAVGLVINPLYEEERAPTVASKLLETSKLSSVDDATLRRMVTRFVQVLSDHNLVWRTWSAEWPTEVIERIGDGAIRASFEGAGWRQETLGSIEWKR